MLSVQLVAGVTSLYVALLFLAAWYADRRFDAGKSIIDKPHVYAFSIAIYATSWTFYGSVGKAATTGLDFLLIYLGPSLTAFSWLFLLRKVIRISKENNITSIADFISSRYGKSQWLGALVTTIAVLGIMPYIALQLKAVATTFEIICGEPHLRVNLLGPRTPLHVDSGFFIALILSIFGVIFGARRRRAGGRRHEGIVAAVAFESLVKLAAFLVVGSFVTYFLYDGLGDIFTRMQEQNGVLLDRLTTMGEGTSISYTTFFSTLVISMGAIMLLPRQFHIMVIENTREEHVKEAMWLFPSYLFLINLFVLPVALAGILYTGSSAGADYFMLTIPLKSGHSWLALVAFIGGFSAAAGMVMVESIAISTMFLDHILMPIVIRLKPRIWFPAVLVNSKRIGIFLVVFLGYAYYTAVGDELMLVNMGLISFVAAAQFGPAFIGGLYWRRGNRAGAFTGTFLGFLTWLYTLLLPSIIESGWIGGKDILQDGPFGISLLKPTALFGLTGFDISTHAVFWSLFLNIGSYVTLSILLPQDEQEREQARKFVDVFAPKRREAEWEQKRLSKPITIVQFIALMSKFIGEAQAHAAITEYLGNREIDEKGRVSEFELPSLKRFIEKTLAGAVGAAAAGAIVESYLSDIGSRMESFYDAFSNVRTSLAESREALYVRLRASEIMSRTLDLQIIIDDLLQLILKEFKLDLAIVRLLNERGVLAVRAYKGTEIRNIIESEWVPEVNTYIGDAFLSNRTQFINDTEHVTKPRSKSLMEEGGVRSFAHIPIARQGEPPIGILSVFSKSIIGLFTEPFLQLLSSLAGQLAQAVTISLEMEAREKERLEKERALLENAKVLRDMEIAKQIQMSLLPADLPQMEGVSFAGLCVPAAHVGGDYYDFLARENGGVDVVIADVSGHNVGAALIMAETRSVLRAQAVYSSAGAAEVLARLNNLLYDDLSNAELFITMFYVKYRPADSSIVYANAGHNHPLLLQKGSERCGELDAEGLILGIKRDITFEEKRLQLSTGDLLLLYTDGIVEAQNSAGDFFGTERLCSTLVENRDAEPQEIMDMIISRLKDFSESTTQVDDISLVVMKVV